MSPTAALLVLVGGFFGGVARFFVSGVVGRRIGELFPWGTLVVNATGCLAIGLLSGLAMGGGLFAAPWMRDLAVVGFCGGYTTVSSFALQSLTLATGGERLNALLNVLASVALSLAAAALGLHIALAAAT